MSKISTTCYKCGGSGEWVNQTNNGDIPVDPCPICKGSGKLPIYDVDLSDVTDKLNDVLDKCNDIMEKLNE